VRGVEGKGSARGGEGKVSSSGADGNARERKAVSGGRVSMSVRREDRVGREWVGSMSGGNKEAA